MGVGGGMVCRRRDPKVSRASPGLGERAEGTSSLAALSGLPLSGHPSPSVLPGHAARPSDCEEVGSDFRGLCGSTNLQYSCPHPGGPRDNSSERRFSEGSEGGEEWRSELICPSRSPGAEGHVWEWGASPRWCSPIPRGLCGLCSVSAP